MVYLPRRCNLLWLGLSLPFDWVANEHLEMEGQVLSRSTLLGAGEPTATFDGKEWEERKKKQMQRQDRDARWQKSEGFQKRPKPWAVRHVPWDRVLADHELRKASGALQSRAFATRTMRYLSWSQPRRAGNRRCGDCPGKINIISQGTSPKEGGGEGPEIAVYVD